MILIGFAGDFSPTIVAAHLLSLYISHNPFYAKKNKDLFFYFSCIKGKPWLVPAKTEMQACERAYVMDILFLLKLEQENVLKLSRAFKEQVLGSSEGVAGAYADFKIALNLYFSIDDEFLYQEIGDLFPNAHKSIDYGMKLHTEIGVILAKLDSCISDSRDSASLVELADSLCQAVVQHIGHQQENIIPRMRERIPTQEREDLAEVFSEIKEELLKESPVSRPSGELVI